MMQRNKGQIQVTRLRIRNAIRSVIYNRMWLLDTDEQKLTLNVKKNIAMLVRTQQRIGLLTMADKSALRTPSALRTIEDRKRLVNLIVNLKCFSYLSPKVRARLVPIITFLYVGPGRTIIRHGDPPRYVYFILTGEVEVMEPIWNPMENEYIDQVKSIAGPGECIGELDIIRGCLRKNTYITRSNVEFFVVFEDDFDHILREEMTKIWMEKKYAFEALHYFDHFTEDQLLKGCKIAELRQFEPLETIYYEDKGHVSYVYFIVSGECIILQCLKLKVMEKDGKKSFELVDLSKNQSEGDLFQGFQSEDAPKLQNKQSKDDSYDIDEEIKSEGDAVEPVVTQKPKRVIKNKTLQEIEFICELMKQSNKVVRYSDTSIMYAHEPLKFEDGEEMNEGDRTSEISNIERTDSINFENSENFDTAFETADNDETIDSNAESEIDDEDLMLKDVDSIEHATSLEELNKEGSSEFPETIESEFNLQDTNVEQINEPIENSNVNIEDEVIEHTHFEAPGNNDEDVTIDNIVKTDSTKKQKRPMLDKNYKLILKKNRKKNEVQVRYENRFIDVGSLLFGGIFGLGEKLEHRVIMARSTVQCLLIPRYWLFESLQNPGNIWQRRRFYLNTCIPSRQHLFSGFLRERTWIKFKDEIVQKVLEEAVSGNPTKVQDIPIICRIVAAQND